MHNTYCALLIHQNSSNATTKESVFNIILNLLNYSQEGVDQYSESSGAKQLL